MAVILDPNAMNDFLAGVFARHGEGAAVSAQPEAANSQPEAPAPVAPKRALGL